MSNVVPAEWEPQASVVLALPHMADEWGTHFDRALSETEEFARAVGDCLLLEPHTFDYGDVWLRDTGPVFIHTDEGIAAVCFRFNGWGEKYVFPHDDTVGPRLAAQLGIPFEKVPELVAEGGALEHNGQGTLITTRQCLLNRNRNPTLGQRDVEQILRRTLGAHTVLWLNEGLANDHTDGHVDNLARFVRPDRVLCARATDGDPNRDVHLEIERILRGHPGLDVDRLPSPGPLEADGVLLPASYLNFVVTDQAVFVPSFGRPTDEEALEIMAQHFPERRAIPISVQGVLTGGGALHCISRDVPAP